MKKPLKHLIGVLFFITLSFGTISCMQNGENADIQAKAAELTKELDSLQLILGKLLSDPNGIDKEAVSATMKEIVDTREAYEDLKNSGASWYDIGKGALGGVLGRTVVHGLRAAIMAYFPGPIGAGIAGLLGMALGGSVSTRKEEETPQK